MMTQENSILPETWIWRNGNLSFTKIQDEFVILHHDTQVYYGIGGIGSEIWEKLQVPIQFQTLIEDLHSLYEVNEECLYADVTQFLRDLKKAKLIDWGSTRPT